jgi:hypothetical protein
MKTLKCDQALVSFFSVLSGGFLDPTHWEKAEKVAIFRLQAEKRGCMQGPPAVPQVGEIHL